MRDVRDIILQVLSLIVASGIILGAWAICNGIFF